MREQLSSPRRMTDQEVLELMREDSPLKSRTVKTKAKKTPTPPSPDDTWFSDCDRVVAQAMILWLKEINVQRAINTLTMAELTLLARVAVDTWLVKQSYRAAEQAPYPEPQLSLF